MRVSSNSSLFNRLNRFTWLMDLYADNFQRLTAMVDLKHLKRGVYFSEGQDGLLLRLEVVECHSYTIEIKLSYTLQDEHTGALDPSAMIRVYLDSQQSEVSHCYVGKRWQDVLGLRPNLAQLVSHRLRMNGFLNKWLMYLKQQNHHKDSWFPEVNTLAFIENE
ncbi:MAG: DUF1249 domain-containing protein [Arenimonas sp.]|nr:DUF1249 domain-containing protein [Arenimonas sp.]